MPISKKWSRATSRHVRENALPKSGVYELKAFGELVYVGHAKDLQERLLDHLRARNPKYYRYDTAGLFQRPSRMEQNHIEAYGRKGDEIPPSNKRDPRGER